MALAPGSRLGPYEVTALLGEGGMGQVWRAHHTALRRDDALKVLPDAFVSDPERLARFQREAQVLASLNHPNIAHVHGLERSDGVQALVMELVEGPTLADRIAQGPIPVDEALPVAKQIAEALEAAHEQGIIHRDLKPANIKLRPDGTVKVLDFGLAKALEPMAARGDATASPTITSPAMMTGVGVLLGTAAYMSPEQARGQAVDRGADIWAFGCTLYEMLTGHRVFEGDDVSETLASVLRAEPDWSSLPADTPAAVRRVLHRCLERDRRHRLADIRDARLDLEETSLEVPIAHTGTLASRSGERVLWLAALGLLTVLALWPTLRDEDVSSETEAHLEFRTPVTNDLVSLAIAPDGRKVAFVGELEGRSLLWVYSIDTGQSAPLRGTEGASFPFWAPDSRAIGFFATERLKRVNLDGGLPSELGPAPVGTGGAWAPDGTILYPIVPDSPLMMVPAGGERRPPVLAPNSGAMPGQPGERFPQFLPDGRRYLYYIAESRGVFLGTLDGPERRRLFEADAAAVVAPPSEVLFVRGGVLYRQTLDLNGLRLLGDPITVATGVGVSALGAAPVSASAVGRIAYRTGSVGRERQLAWIDRAGNRVQTIGDPDSGAPANVSLFEGRRLALNRSLSGNTDIYVIGDLARAIVSRFTDEPTPDVAPVWSPDGQSLLFSQAIPPTNRFALHIRSIEAAGKARAVLGPAPDIQIAMDWKGDRVLYRTLDQENGWDIWTARIADKPQPEPVIRTRFEERNARFSPDATFIAYESNRSGAYEIYLRRSDGHGEEVPVSSGGGIQPRWSPDGSEVFYVAPDGWLVAVALNRSPDDDLTLSVPDRLFFLGPVGGGGTGYDYDVGANSQRFLVIAFVERAPEPISVILKPLARAR